MQAPPDVSTNAYQELAAYLRKNPGATKESSAEIAAHLGLPKDIVETVLANAQGKRERRVESVQPTRDNVFREAFPQAWLFIRRMLSKPVLLAGVTTSVAIVATVAAGLLFPGTAAGLALGAITSITCFCLQMMSFLLNGKARYPLYAAGVNWVLITLTSLIGVVLNPADLRGTPFTTSGLVILMLLAFMLLASMYAGAGVLVSVLGGYFSLRKEDKVRRNLTRQELLERLFEIEEQIRLGGHEGPAFNYLEWKPVAWVRKNPYFTAAIVGFLFHMLQALILQALGIDDWEKGRQSPEMAAVGMIGILGFVVMVVNAFLAGTIGRAFLTVLVYFAVGMVASLIPIGPFGLEYLKALRAPQWIAMLVMDLSIALIAGLGGRIEHRAARERLLQANDPATLLGEMLEIQAKLNPDTNTVCVMVVDAAKSAEMKSGADPLAVEYSFREYQKMIERLSAGVGGRVHATAGDGAVVAFGSALAAFEAARKIQTEIETFNMQLNRIPVPFRLRVGLHMGAVAGLLEKIEFTEVIDIAAHVQGVAPIGGIALTEAVVSMLEGVETIPLKDPVDGQNVFLALNPRVEA